VITKDVLQTGYYLTLFGPSFVYVRYRCSRCKRVGEQLIEEDKWNPEILAGPSRGPSRAKRKRFEQLGPITPEEILDFHFALEKMDSLPKRGS